jgi:hypothetical protein
MFLVLLASSTNLRSDSWRGVIEAIFLELFDKSLRGVIEALF